MYCRLKPYASRYETTVGLPIEYGALNVGNVASGMLFYGEVRYPPPHQPATLLERGHTCSVMDGCALSARPTHDMMEGSQLAITPRAGALHVGRPAVACDRWRRPTARRHRCRSVAASAAHAAHAAPVERVAHAELGFRRAPNLPLLTRREARRAEQPVRHTRRWHLVRLGLCARGSGPCTRRSVVGVGIGCSPSPLSLG